MGKLFIDDEGLSDDWTKGAAEQQALLQQLKDHLRNYYLPVTDPAEAEFHFTTKEVFDQLFRILPNGALYSPADVAGWLTELNFRFFDYGEMRLEWMMKKA